MRTVLFMKALPGVMETNCLLTMRIRILFTRLRLHSLFQMRLLTAFSSLSHIIIISIFQKQPVPRDKEKMNGYLQLINQAIRHIYECTPHQPMASATPFLRSHPKQPSVQSFQRHTRHAFSFLSNVLWSRVECSQLKIGLLTKSE